jgi:hypothetical protein
MVFYSTSLGAKTRFAGCKYCTLRVQTRAVAGAKTRVFEPQKFDASKFGNHNTCANNCCARGAQFDEQNRLP